MSLKLSNPKTFLALLLFIGFFFVLMGTGWSGTYIAGGVLIMFLAVGLWIMANRRRMGL